ncbi:MAG: hypothetical protein NZ902_00920 [Acidilobaceae archaeon]|nr:hypothetical protein [Acidilobaceae archaeon]MCX8165391.1 hypothetical protein [Acidilobaceae archaeon]MDW7973818.1 hypothetical protein [Sulfolobales archaeon]
MLYELPELYKALALVHERAKGDESWKVIFERISYLVSYFEWLNSMGKTVDINLAVQMKGVGVKVLQLAEGGNAAGMLETFEKVMEASREIEGPLRASHNYVTVLRIATSLLVLTSSALLLLWALSEGLVVTATLFSLAAGTALGSLLAFSFSYSQWALGLSVLLQALSSLTALQRLSWAEASLIVLSALITVGLIWISSLVRKRLNEFVKRLDAEVMRRIGSVGEGRSF